MPACPVTTTRCARCAARDSIADSTGWLGLLHAHVPAPAARQLRKLLTSVLSLQVCAMKLATGGKCKVCHNLFGQLRRINHHH
jgi:hypothetical protein